MDSKQMLGTTSTTFQTTPIVSSQLENTSQVIMTVSIGSTLSGQGTQQGSTNPLGPLNPIQDHNFPTLQCLVEVSTHNSTIKQYLQ